MRWPRIPGEPPILSPATSAPSLTTLRKIGLLDERWTLAKPQRRPCDRQFLGQPVYLNAPKHRPIESPIARRHQLGGRHAVDLCLEALVEHLRVVAFEASQGANISGAEVRFKGRDRPLSDLTLPQRLPQGRFWTLSRNEETRLESGFPAYSGGGIRTRDLRVIRMSREIRWTTWSPVSSGFLAIELRGDRLESVGAPASPCRQSLLPWPGRDGRFAAREVPFPPCAVRALQGPQDLP